MRQMKLGNHAITKYDEVWVKRFCWPSWDIESWKSGWRWIVYL
jgi:hypothetical protein